MREDDRMSGVWGIKAEEFFWSLRDQNVLIQTTQGRYKGTLVGCSPYTLVVHQENGLEILIFKGQIVYVHRG